MRIADSSELEGANPLAKICASSGDAAQSSLTAICVCPEKSCSSGFASVLGTPSAASDGPRARTTTVFGCEPWMIKPPISTSSPVRTCPRVEMLKRRGIVLAAGVRRSIVPPPRLAT
jgi:hypothetical protein